MSNYPPSSDTSDASTLSSSDLSSLDTILIAGAQCTSAVNSSDSDSVSTSTGTSRLMSPGVRRPLMAAAHRTAIESPPSPPVPPDGLTEAGTSSGREGGPIWKGREDFDLIHWEPEGGGQPGGCRPKPPTLPALGPRPVREPGQSAETGARGASTRPRFPSFCPTHQPQQPSAPPEPGEPLAAIMATIDQLRQVNMQQQHEMKVMREEIAKMKCTQSGQYNIGLGPDNPEHKEFEVQDRPSTPSWSCISC